MLNELLGYRWASSPTRFAIAAAVTVAFALLARVLRGVNRSGMLAGGAGLFPALCGRRTVGVRRPRHPVRADVDLHPLRIQPQTGNWRRRTRRRT